MSDMQVLRIGKISSMNYKNGTARVTYEDRDGATTGELPFLAWTYWMPKVEDQVVVGHLSSKSSAAVILGPVWNDDHRPAAYGADRYRQEMGADTGQAVIDYSTKTGILTIRAERIEFDAYADDVDITAAAIVSRIRALEKQCANLESRCSANGI